MTRAVESRFLLSHNVGPCWLAATLVWKLVRGWDGGAGAGRSISTPPCLSAEQHNLQMQYNSIRKLFLEQ